MEKYVGKRVKVEIFGIGSDDAYYTVSTSSWTIISEQKLNDGRQTITMIVPNNAKYGQFSCKKGELFRIYFAETINDRIYNLGKFITPEMYGAIGDGITDDTEAFQRMLDDTENRCYPIMLSADKYLICNGLTDTIGHVFLPNKSTIIGNFSGYMLTVNISDSRYATRSCEYNLTIDGEHISDGIHVIGSIGNTFNVVIKNAPNIGFYLDRSNGESVCENRIDVQIDSIGSVGEIGLYMDGNDNYVYSAIVINYKIGIKNNGNTHYTYIHGWLDRNAENMWADSILYLDVTNTNGGNITYLYADTYRYGVKTENYAFVNINLYYCLINTNEIPISKVIEEKHVAFSGNGSAVINCFETYRDASIVNIIEASSVKPRIKIDNCKGIDFIKTASFSQFVFPCGIMNDYWSFSSLPNEIKTAYVDSVVGITPISFGGTNAIICRYYGVNKIFINFNSGVNSENWQSITIN